MQIQLRKCALLQSGIGAAALLAGQPAFAHVEGSNFVQGGPLSTSNDLEAAAEDAKDGGVEEIVVTARGRVERLQDVPVSASVVTSAELQRTGSNLGSLSTLVPTLRIARGGSGTGGSVAIRGISGSISNAGLEQKVALNFDGVQVAKARFIATGFFDAASVQVLEGPQSLYFGKNATAGVVAITSIDPGHEPEGYVRAGYEVEAQEYLFEAAYSLPVNDTLRLRVAGSYANMTKGYLRNDVPIVLQDGVFSGQPPFRTTPRTRSMMLRSTLVWEPAETIEAKLKLTYSDFDTEGSKDAPAQTVCKPGQANQGIAGGAAEPYDDCVLTATS